MFLNIYFSWFCKFVIIYKNFLNVAFYKIDSQLDSIRFVINKDLPANKKLPILVKKQPADKQASKKLRRLKELEELDELEKLYKFGKSGRLDYFYKL